MASTVLEVLAIALDAGAAGAGEVEEQTMTTFLLITIVAFPMYAGPGIADQRIEQHFGTGPFRTFAACEATGREIERRRQASRGVTVQWFCTINT